MKTIFFILLFPALGYSQMTAFFETTVYFEDAIGNFDSVIVGHDPSVQPMELNTQFGEVDISDVPYDSVFEVRAVHMTEYFNGTDLAYSKKIIGPVAGGINSANQCYKIVEASIFFVRAVHQPITIKWKQEDFINSYCREATFIATHFWSLLIDPWYEVPEFLALSECIAYDSTYTVSLNSTCCGEQTTQVVPVEGGGMDTVFAILLNYRHRGSSNSPCVLTAVEAEPPLTAAAPMPYPNPSMGHFQLAGPATEGVNYEVLNYQGQVVLRQSCNAEIDLSDQPNGLYYLRGWLGERAFSRVLVKMK